MKLKSGGMGMEATAGIEPADKGFADLCLTTWLRRLTLRRDSECSEPPGERQYSEACKTRNALRTDGVTLRVRVLIALVRLHERPRLHLVAVLADAERAGVGGEVVRDALGRVRRSERGVGEDVLVRRLNHDDGVRHDHAARIRDDADVDEDVRLGTEEEPVMKRDGIRRLQLRGPRSGAPTFWTIRSDLLDAILIVLIHDLPLSGR